MFELEYSIKFLKKFKNLVSHQLITLKLIGVFKQLIRLLHINFQVILKFYVFIKISKLLTYS